MKDGSLGCQKNGIAIKHQAPPVVVMPTILTLLGSGMAFCEKCGGRAYVIEARRRPGDNIRRRFQCKSCGDRWTVWNGERPPSAAPETRLSDEAIFDILTDRSPQPVLAQRHNCSLSAVGRIRRGEMHAKIHPEIPRFKDPVKTGRKTCKKCNLYTGFPSDPCSLGHVDPIEEGLTFASYCSSFTS